MITIQALGVSEGLVKAKAFVLREPDLSVTKQKIEDVAAEQARVDAAVETAKAQIEAIMEEAGETLGDKAEIFEAHLMMMEDEDYLDGMKAIIADENVCAEYACKVNCGNFQDMLRAIDDEYMQARAADVGDISMRILKVLKGISDNALDAIDEPCILVANDLTPSDTAKVSRRASLKTVITSCSMAARVRLWSIRSRTMRTSSTARRRALTSSAACSKPTARSRAQPRTVTVSSLRATSVRRQMRCV